MMWEVFIFFGMNLPTSKKTNRIILFGAIFLLGVIVTWIVVFNNRTKINPGEIEAQIAPDATVTPTTLQELIQHFEDYDLPDTVYQKINRDLKMHTFLSKDDPSAIEQILAVPDSNARTDTLHSLLKNNKYSLYLLITRLLNHTVYLKKFALQNIAPESESFKLIEWLISKYDDPIERAFLQSELQFYQSLAGVNIEKKLRLEYLAAKSHAMSQKNRDSCLQYFGAGLRIAHSLKDKKKEIDLLTTLQFTLNYADGLSNIGLALGRQLLNEAKAMGYIAQLHYYNGLCYVDKGHFPEAQVEYQRALEVYREYNHFEQIGPDARTFGSSKPPHGAIRPGDE